MRGTPGQRGGWNAHNSGMFCSCTPSVSRLCMHFLLPVSRGYADQKNPQPVSLLNARDAERVPHLPLESRRRSRCLTSGERLGFPVTRAKGMPAAPGSRRWRSRATRASAWPWVHSLKMRITSVRRDLPEVCRTSAGHQPPLVPGAVFGGLDHGLRVLLSGRTSCKVRENMRDEAACTSLGCRAQHQSSCALHPTRCVPRPLLTAPHAATARGLPNSQGRPCWHA